MLTVIVLALFTGAILLDFLPKIKKRQKKVNIVYCLLLVLSFGILMLYSFGVKVPSPTQAIEAVVKMIVPVK